MKVTTKDIIKILPVGDDFRHKFLDRYDKLTPDQKYDVEGLLWDAYDALFSMKLQENIELGMLEMQVNGGELDGTFYKKMEEKTRKQIVDEFHKEVTDVDLSAVRQKLETYIGGPQNGQPAN